MAILREQQGFWCSTLGEPWQEPIVAYDFREVLTDRGQNSYDLTGTGIVAGDFITGFSEAGKTVVSLASGKFADLASNATINFGTADFSVELVVKTSQASEFVVASKWDEVALTGWFVSLVNGDVRFRMKDAAAGNVDATKTASVDDGNFHVVHINTDRDANVEYFVDAVSIGTQAASAASGSISNSAKFRMNGLNDATLQGTVDVDLIRTYTKILTNVVTDDEIGLHEQDIRTKHYGSLTLDSRWF